MQIILIASGSGGNATLFSSGGTRILVDAGVGPRVVSKALEALEGGGPPGSGASWAPDAVVITHAHADHVGCAARYNKRLRIPIHATEATARAVHLGDRARVCLYSAREPFMIGGFTISPRPLPHDAAQVALVISDGARSAALVTDLGEVPPGLIEHIAGSDVLLIESNHDERMLAEGPYPPHLKRRIQSARGHLSNAQTHALLAALVRAERGAARPVLPHTVVLMHLSEVNNLPGIALEVAADALGGAREGGATTHAPLLTAAGARLLAAPPRGPLRIDAAAPRPAPLPPHWPPSRCAPQGVPRQLSLFPSV